MFELLFPPHHSHWLLIKSGCKTLLLTSKVIHKLGSPYLSELLYVAFLLRSSSCLHLTVPTALLSTNVLVWWPVWCSGRPFKIKCITSAQEVMWHAMPVCLLWTKSLKKLGMDFMKFSGNVDNRPSNFLIDFKCKTVQRIIYAAFSLIVTSWGYRSVVDWQMAQTRACPLASQAS